MMWHFYEIPYIPDLELVKYQSLGEQGIDGILERHNRFLRQWQRNTVLIHTTLHFFLSYTHERPKGSRLQIFLAFSSDQTVNFESIAVKLVPVLKSLTSSQPHDTTSMVHVLALLRRSMNLPEFISTKTWVMLVLSEALIRISVANDG